MATHKDVAFNASKCNNVVAGHCVCMNGTMDQIVYAGPINKAPEVTGMIVFMHETDFAKLQGFIAKRRH